MVPASPIPSKHKDRKERKNHKMIILRKNEHKVKKIYIDGNFMKRMALLGYNTEATLKDSIAIKKRVERIENIYKQLKDEVQKHKVSNNNKESNYENYIICTIMVRVKNKLQKAMLIELHDDPVDDIDPHEWPEQEVTLQWENNKKIERLPMNRVKKVIKKG